MLCPVLGSDLGVKYGKNILTFTFDNKLMAGQNHCATAPKKKKKYCDMNYLKLNIMLMYEGHLLNNLLNWSHIGLIKSFLIGCHVYMLLNTLCQHAGLGDMDMKYVAKIVYHVTIWIVPYLERIYHDV